jgi:hypothetical protein
MVGLGVVPFLRTRDFGPPGICHLLISGGDGVQLKKLASLPEIAKKMSSSIYLEPAMELFGMKNATVINRILDVELRGTAWKVRH